MRAGAEWNFLGKRFGCGPRPAMLAGCRSVASLSIPLEQWAAGQAHLCTWEGEPSVRIRVAKAPHSPVVA